jgi:hypothetical protein
MVMAYIRRSAEGAIIAASAAQKIDANWQEIDDKDPEYVAYLEQAMMTSMPFRESDIQFSRVLEDLITILIDRHVIQFTDFPLAAQNRMNERQSMRQKSRISSLLDESDEIALSG